MENNFAIATHFHNLLERIFGEEVKLTKEWVTEFKILGGNNGIRQGPYIIASLVYMFESIKQRPDEIGSILCQQVGPYNNEEASRVFDEYLFDASMIYNLIEIWTHKEAIPSVFNISMINSKFCIAHQAAANDDLDTLIWVLNNGVEVDCRDHDGRTPLHVAAAFGSLRIVNELITRGASIRTFDNANQTPFEKALLREHFEIANLFEPHLFSNRLYEDGETLLFRLIRGEMEAQLEYLLRYATVRFVNPAQQNFLHVAASTGNVRIIALLLRCHSNPEYLNAFDVFDMSPLHVAALGNHAATVEVLLHYGALINEGAHNVLIEKNDSNVMKSIRMHAYFRMGYPSYDPSNHPDQDLLNSLLKFSEPKN